MVRASLLCTLLLGAAGPMPGAGQLRGPVRTEPPVQPSNGAALVVIASEALCQGDLELLVARTQRTGRRLVFQTPILPPECEWTIADPVPGEYQAVIQKARGDRRVIAMSQLRVYPGSTWTATPSFLDAIIEGSVRIDGFGVGAGTYVQAQQNGAPGYSWDTFTDDNGRYTLTVMPDDNMCVRVRLPGSLNSIFSSCGVVTSGANHRDFDVPPGRIEVTLVPREGPMHDTPVLLVLDTPGPAMSCAVTVTGRTTRPFVGLPYGKHRLRATTMDYSRDFDSAEVVLSPVAPVRGVTLSVPYSR